MLRRRPPLRLLRLANPIVRLVLRSPAHGVLSRSLMLLTYRGRLSGRSFTIPVMYARRGDSVIALASARERKQWWRAFRKGAPATLRIAGRVVTVDGRLLEGTEADHALDAFLTRFPRTSSTLGASADEVALIAFEER